jgi:hypothetical protein
MARILGYAKDFSAVLGILNVVLVGFIGVGVLKIREALAPESQFTLACPDDTQNQQATIFGGRPKSDGVVDVFVSPQDGVCQYYPQDGPTTTSIDRGSWAKLVRLGNPFGLGHRSPLPLDFDILAVLHKQDWHIAEGELNRGCSASPLGDRILVQPGTIAARACRLRRLPEAAMLCFDMPHIVSPVPGCCSFDANSVSCKQDCSPTTLTQVHSPVTVEWTSKAPMSLSIARHPPGQPEAGFPRTATSGEHFDLSPGIYELSIRREPGHRCVSLSWFEVIPP